MTILYYLLTLCFIVPQVLWGQAPTDAVNPHSEAGTFVAPRELLILKPAQDKLWGTWVVAVMNQSKTPQELAFLAHLPREAVDFQPAEGVEAKDLILGDDGLVIKKVFEPGVNVVGLGFAVEGGGGDTVMTLRAARAVPDLIVMTPSHMLQVSSPGLTFQGSNAQDGQNYDTYRLTAPLSQGQSLEVSVKGIPEGRSRLWWNGAIFGLALCSISAGLAWKTRPGKSDEIELGVTTL